MSCYGPKIIAGDGPANADYDWFYLCAARQDMIPVPLGFVPVIDGEPEREEDNAGW